ncbi:hypothetical protein [Clostridium ganghwense]|uniref:Uncharacterized protein n=1 Tax=Clostridium ganghwense TaxID=312089 RepID=A0ABT4CRY0_9CLOT|nr:hypothetical protein [Clostridium ganghwense]MCY6371173.1 hypothetical protein [Clostridium ganghwense]
MNHKFSIILNIVGIMVLTCFVIFMKTNIWHMVLRILLIIALIISSYTHYNKIKKNID